MIFYNVDFTYCTEKYITKMDNTQDEHILKILGLTHDVAILSSLDNKTIKIINIAKIKTFSFKRLKSPDYYDQNPDSSKYYLTIQKFLKITLLPWTRFNLKKDPHSTTVDSTAPTH